MADFRRRGWAMRSRPLLAAPRLIEEEITPSSGWIQLPEFHYLLVDLPGFKKDDITLDVEESGSIVVSGRRRIGEEKQVHFKKSFNVPEDGDIKRISMIFEEDTLRVSVPKVAREMKEEPKKTNSSDTKRSTNDIGEKEKEKAESPASTSSSHPKEEAEGEKKDSHPKEKAEEEKKDKTEESPAFASSSHPKEEAEEEKKDETQESPASASSSHPKEEAEEEKKDEIEKTPASASSRNPKERAEKKKKDETAEEPQSKNQLIVKISEYKGILMASIISFTLGVLLSQKFHPLPPK